MRVYLARQAIYDLSNKAVAYELLYRHSVENAFPSGMDGSQATMSLISDAHTVFGIHNIVNDKPAYVNFTRVLLLEKIAHILEPSEVVVEILEDVSPDAEILERLGELRERGYTIALDDCVNDDSRSAMMPFVDIVKADFSLMGREERQRFAERTKGRRLLAEKIETQEDYDQAKAFGFELFQGYYFSKPVVLSRVSGEIANGTCSRVLREIYRETPDYGRMSEIIRNDVALSFRILHYINTLRFYRGRRIDSIRAALLRIGINEIRRWFSLAVAKSLMAGASNPDLTSIALIRGVFAEQLAESIGLAHPEDAFQAGMFSLIDVVMGSDLDTLVDSLCLADEAKQALLGEENELRTLLDFVIEYEKGNINGNCTLMGTQFTLEKLSAAYWDAVLYADKAFAEPGTPAFS